MRKIIFRGKPKSGYNYGNGWLYECTVNAIDLVCDLADVVGLPYDFD